MRRVSYPSTIVWDMQCLLCAAPLLQFLTKSIEDRRCELSKPVALCVPMENAQVEAAYHVGRRQVVVNSLVVSTQQDAIRLLLHELTHAFDACRVYLDPTDCRHAACTEVSNAAAATRAHTKRTAGVGWDVVAGLQAGARTFIRAALPNDTSKSPPCTADSRIEPEHGVQLATRVVWHQQDTAPRPASTAKGMRSASCHCVNPGGARLFGKGLC